MRIAAVVIFTVGVLATFRYGPWWSHVVAIVACGAAPVVAPLVTRDDMTWRDVPAVARFLLRSQVLAALNPYVFVQASRQTAGQLAAFVRYRGRLPAPATYEAPVRLRLPRRGHMGTVANGGPTPATSHSWGACRTSATPTTSSSSATAQPTRGDGHRPVRLPRLRPAPWWHPPTGPSWR